MPVTVKTFATPAEAAAALSSDRARALLGGGTLVMRALNEGDVSISTIVRSTDRALTQIGLGGARITIGAGVTLAQILRRARACLSASGRAPRSAAPPCANGRPSAAICSRLRLRRSRGRAAGARRDGVGAGRLWRARHGARGISCRRASATPGALVPQRRLRPAREPEAFRFRKVARVKPKGVSVLTIAAHPPGGRRARLRRAHRLRRDGADCRFEPRPPSARSKGRTLDAPAIAAAVAAARRGHFARQRRHRQRLVSPRGLRRPSAPPAARAGRLRASHGQRRRSNFASTAARSRIRRQRHDPARALRDEVGDIRPRAAAGRAPAALARC